MAREYAWSRNASKEGNSKEDLVFLKRFKDLLPCSQFSTVPHWARRPSSTWGEETHQFKSKDDLAFIGCIIETSG